MYSTCLFCNGSLGRNEVLDAFPVGRRLAFDPAKGRLWVVCRKCERWNLSPLEERWEAFEECERLFRATRMRMSTDNIGLARVPEGLELVRIGEPLRPEFAAWRYGDQFGRRRRRTIIYAGIGVAALAAASVGMTMVGVGAGGIYPLWNALLRAPIRARIRTADGRIVKVRGEYLKQVRLTRDAEGGWVASLPHGRRVETFTGTDAERVMRVLLPAVNRMGGTRSVIKQAVVAIEEAGDADAFVSQMRRSLPSRYAPRSLKDQGLLGKIPLPTRLALEMALHEEQERRALVGELVELELAWRETEEVAAIADNMFVPPEHEAFIAEHRPRRDAEADGSP